MATLNRTFSVKNGIDVANTIIVDASRNLSNIVTANANTVNATTFVTSAGLNVTDQANNAYGQANAAYDKANSGFGQANAAYAQANAARGQANTAYGAANNAANTVRVSANGGSTLSQKQLNFVSTPSIEVAVIDAGDGNANIVFNTTGAAVADAYAQANAAYGQANAAYGQANAAYADANTRVLKSGDTMTGNLTVNANINVTNTFISKKTVLQKPSTANTNGERLRLYDFDEAGHPNYAIGVEPNYVWVGTDENNGGTGFKWYGNTTQAAVMLSNGTLQLSNTVEAKIIRANGTGTAIDASQGNVLTNQVTGTAFNFLAGANTITVDASGATANYTFNLPANSGLVGQILATDGTGDTYFTSAPYVTANDAYGQANAAYGKANTALDTANGAYAQANGAYAQANGAFAQANGAYAQANGAYAQANGAYAQANGAYGMANLKVASITSSGNGLAVGNTTSSNLNEYTISVLTASTAVRGTTLLIDSTSSTDTGNAATANAVNATYDFANTKLPLSGGTISGDLTVSGNLYLSQNTTLINVSTYQVADPLIYLASNNDISDTVDIGFMGGKNTSGTYSHTGLIRHAADQKYYLFDGLADEAHTNNVVNVASTYLATLRANIEANSITLVGQTVATQANLTLAHNQANAAYAQANAAYADSNTRVLKSGDTMTGALTITTANVGLTVANANVTYSLQVGTLNVTTNTVTTSSSGQVVLDKFPATQLASAKYFIQAKSSTDYHTTEMVLVQDETNVWITEYGSIQTGPSLGSFSADISSGDVRLLFNATNNVNTIRAVRYGIIP
jgi:uncharacterized Zn ribbon protein